MKKKRRTVTVRVLAVLALGALGVSALAAAGCTSISKAELELQLAALEKNRALGAPVRRPLSADLGTGVETLDLVSYSATADHAVARVPVLLVHGTPSTLFTWSELIHGSEDFEGLAARRDVHALEVIGHGIAPASTETLTFERCARYVAAAVRELGLERVHVVGSSYGGEFAWRAVLNDPELFESLVLIDSSGYARRDADWLPEEIEMRENSLAKVGWLINSRSRIETALAPHFDVIPPGRVEEFFLVCENESNWAGMVDLARDENGERQAEIPTIEAPTLVLWGADDVAYRLDVYGERFASEIAGAALRVLPDTGHYPHEQRPAEVVQALEAFFSRVEAR